MYRNLHADLRTIIKFEMKRYVNRGIKLTEVVLFSDRCGEQFSVIRIMKRRLSMVALPCSLTVLFRAASMSCRFDSTLVRRARAAALHVMMKTDTTIVSTSTLSGPQATKPGDTNSYLRQRGVKQLDGWSIRLSRSQQHKSQAPELPTD